MRAFKLLTLAAILMFCFSFINSCYFIRSGLQKEDNLDSQTDVWDEIFAQTDIGQNVLAYVEGGFSPGSHRSNIWLLDLDSGNRTILTKGTDMNLSPRFSPDGSRIVFSSNRDGLYDIWLMNVDGSGLTNLTKGFEINMVGAGWPYEARDPYFSPDGTKIIYSSNEEVYVPNGTEFANCFEDIWIMDTDGSNRKNLTKYAKMHLNPDETSHARDFCPVFTPDGRHIVFAAYRVENAPQAEWTALWIMDADGTNQSPLIDPIYGGYSPCISPDGTKIAFTTQYDAGSSSNVWIVDIDGSNIKNLTNHPRTGYGEKRINVFDPCFSPDGSKIIYNHFEGNRCDIWIMDADGSNNEILLSLPGDQWGAVFKQ
jgi:Tol biopolymer transport system component